MAKAEQEGFPYSALSPEQRRRYDLLLAGLDLLDQAIAVFDATPKLVTWNKAMLRLLDFPESMVRVGTPFEDFARFNAERGEYGPGDVETLVRQRVAAARSFQPHYVERALHELHHADLHAVADRAHRHAERGRSLALAGAGVDDDQTLLDRFCRDLLVLRGLDLLHLRRMFGVGARLHQKLTRTPP